MAGAQEAAGTLAGLCRRHGSRPAAWEERRAAEGPPQHDPKTSTVYEAGTQERGPGASMEGVSGDQTGDHPKLAKPTPEEVRGWAQSFDKLMKSPAGRNVFREFLRTEYSEENMLFWLACEELKTECNKHTIDEKARMIYEDYISILSPKEVSLDSRVREVINRKMQEPSSHTFDDAQLQIYTLMHRDSYPRFLNSAIYKSLLQSVSRSSSES
ncbi:Regulator of G-protein signaling 19 [Aix galericulata]|nr:Regulator of G-protein signaling 19 [Aix galericulata]